MYRVKFAKRELLVNGNFTSLVNGNPILLQIYADDFIETHANLEFDRSILTGVEKYIILLKIMGNILKNKYIVTIIINI